MKRVSIVGLGMSAGTLTGEGLAAVREADALLGAPRLFAQLEAFGKPSFAEHTPQAAAQVIREHPGERFCVLVSGDTGFYSAAPGLCEALREYAPSLIPGVSSLSYFLARLGRPWQDVRALSCHGRRANLTDAVRRSRLTFALTGGNAAELGDMLTEAGFGALPAYAGEELGTPQERVLALPVSEISAAGIGKLAVLLIENDGYDSRVRFGLPDDAFLRGGAPMTKSEVRAVIMSRLALSPGAVCCDIGAGTGSVTAEMALAAYEGHVYAIDRNEEAVRLVRANCRALHIGNVTPILGGAPDALEGLPPFDAAFVGGSAGRLEELFAALFEKNPHIRVAVSAVTLETVAAARAAFAARGIEPEIIQLGAARVKAAGSLHMLEACSPVFVFSGGGNA